MLQKILPAIATYVRNASDSTDLKAVLVEKIPKEQERVKNFRKAKGATKVGDVTVDMVSKNLSKYFLFCRIKTVRVIDEASRI